MSDLYQEHALALVRMAKLLVGDRASAEDVVQDVFLNLHRRLPGLSDRDQMLPYLRAAVVNQSRSLLRKRRRALLRRAQHEPPRKNSTLWLAAGTGRLTFLVAFISEQAQAKCNGRLWLYRLRLTPAGRPLAMTLTATTAVHGLPEAMSQDGQVLATVPNVCSDNPPGRITVLNRATHQTRHWPVAPGSLLDPSLSGNGSLLAYATTSGIALQPTGVAGGSVLSRGRTVARAGEFGPGTTARYPRLAPNGTVYFATYHRGGNGWQLRAYSLATGTTRLVTDLPGKPLGIVSDTSGRYLLLRYDTGTAQSGHVHLGRLDTATGKLTSLAAHASGMDQSVGEAVLAW